MTTQNTNSRIINFLLFFCVIFIALIIRSYFIYQYKIPFTEHYSSLQVQQASIARTITRNGIDIMHPHYLGDEHLSYVPFPFYATILGIFDRYLPIVSLETWGRIITMISSLVLIGCLFWFLIGTYGRISAFFAGIFLASMPFSVYYSQIMTPDITNMACIFLSILCITLFKPTNTFSSYLLFFLGAIFAGIAVTSNPLLFVLFIPLLIISSQKFQSPFYVNYFFYLFFLLAMLPFIAWRIALTYTYQDISLLAWFAQLINTQEVGKNILFSPSFFNTVFNEQILQTVLGGFSIFFIVLGLVAKASKNMSEKLIVGASLFMVILFQNAFFSYDIYLVALLPVLALLFGIGISTLFTEKKIFPHTFLNVLITIFVITFSLLFSFNKVLPFFSANNTYQTIAKIIDTLVDPTATIATDTNGDISLLYYLDRDGTAYAQDIQSLKSRQIKYFLTFDKNKAQSMKNNSKEIFESDLVYLFDIQ